MIDIPNPNEKHPMEHALRVGFLKNFITCAAKSQINGKFIFRQNA